MRYPGDSKAIFVATLAVALVIFMEQLFSGASILSSGFSALCIWLITYPGFRVFLLPLHKYLKAQGRESILPLMFSGLLAGALMNTAFYLFWVLVLGARERFDFQVMVMGALCGAGVAIIFCLTSGTRRLLPSKQPNITDS